MPKHSLFYRLILLLVPALAFSSSLANGFVYDDLIHIVNNPGVQSLKGSLFYWHSPAYPGDLYRPLLFLSYYINHFISGENAFLFHLTNIVLHLITVQLAFSLFKRLFRIELAFISCLIFSVNPVLTEAVAYVSGRADTLAAAAVLLSIISALRVQDSTGSFKAIWTIAQIIFFFVAALCKESALSLVLLTPLVIIFAEQASNNWRQKIFSQPCIIAFLCSALYFLLRYLILGQITSNIVPTYHDNALYNLPWFERGSVALALLGRYFQLILFPLQLSSDYSYSMLAEFIPSDPKFRPLVFIPHLLLIFALLAATWKAKCSELKFGILWFFAAFIVTSNLITPIGTIFGERLAYLPALGVCFAVVGFASQFRLNSVLTQALLGVITLAGAFSCYQNSQSWRDTASLYNAQIVSAPESAKAKFNFGRLLEHQQEYDRAKTYFKSSIDTYPTNIAAMQFLAEALTREKNWSEAEHWFKMALKIAPQSPGVLIALAKHYLTKGEIVKAREALEQATRMKHFNTEGHFLLVRVYLSLGQIDLAKGLFEALKRYNPKDLQLVDLEQEIKKTQRSAE